MHKVSKFIKFSLSSFKFMVLEKIYNCLME